MPGRISRRDLFRFFGGAAVGMVFTPAPWKLLDDVAIWTQNGNPGARPPNGKLSYRHTTCTLCPAACALRVRCVGGQPVSLAGVAGHPASRGAVCPLGLGAHHLPYHPQRLRHPVIRPGGSGPSRDGQGSLVREVSLSHVVGALGAAIAAANGGSFEERIAILDCRPGRSVSALYRAFLSRLRHGVYLQAPSGEEAWFATLQGMLEESYGPLGYDLEHAGMILSFGEPILEGWGTPGRVLGLKYGSGGAHRPPRIVQVETRPSHTALLADRWLAIRPGSEAPLALGLAHVIVRERLHDEAGIREKGIDFDRGGAPDYLRLIQPFTPERVSEITGLSAEAIVETAREFATRGPAVAVGGGDAGGGPLGRDAEVAIWGLNLLVGSVGRRGGVVPRRALPEPTGAGIAAGAAAGFAAPGIDALPDRSIRVLIMDGAPSGSALPWPVLREKLVERDPLVVSLSPYLVGHALHADYAVPGPAFLEAVEEAPSPPGASRASLALSASILPPPGGATDPVELILRAAEAIGAPFLEALSSASLIERRLRALHELGRGHLFHCDTGDLEPADRVTSPDLFVRSVREGACWFDAEPEIPPVPPFRLLGREAGVFERLAALAAGRPAGTAFPRPAYPLVLMPFGMKGVAGGGPVTGLASKLYRESRLRPEPGSALMNPETGRECGVSDGGRARLETPRGSMEVGVRFESLALPGVLHVPVGPEPAQLGESGRGRMEDLLGLCESADRRTWRAAPARIREA